MSCRIAAAVLPQALAFSARRAARQTVSTVDRADPHAKYGRSCWSSHCLQYSFRAFVHTLISPANKPRSRSLPFFFGINGAATSWTCGGTRPESSQASHRVARTSWPAEHKCPRWRGWNPS